MGFEALVLSRINRVVYHSLTNHTGVEFIWRAAPLETGNSADMFTHVLPQYG
jgi:hypothetical protein